MSNESVTMKILVKIHNFKNSTDSVDIITDSSYNSDSIVNTLSEQ